MGGKKKKKHTVDTSVRVNTVTKEVKEEKTSKNSTPSKSSKMFIEVPPGYIRLFKRNPNYNIIINETNSKHFITMKHKSLMKIYNMQNKETETIANYVTLKIDSNTNIVNKFKSIEDLRHNKTYVNLFNYVLMYSCVFEDKSTVDVSKFSLQKILGLLKKDIYDVTDILTINIVSTSYQEFMMKKRQGLYGKALSKVLQYDVEKNEASNILTMRQSIDNARKFKKFNIEDMENYLNQVKIEDIDNRQNEIANKPKRLKGGRRKIKKEKKVYKVSKIE